jgi:hypothetical protein
MVIEGYATRSVESPDSNPGWGVAGRWAVIVAVETYRHPGWAGVPYAEAAAEKFAKALTTTGIPPDRQIHLVGPDATMGAVEARLRNLRKRIRKGDTLLVFLSAITFMNRGETYVALWDALPDLAADSSLPFADFLKLIRKADIESVALFFDPAGEWNDADFEGPPGIASCSPGESSATAAALRSSLWAHLVVEALTGDAAVTLDSIHAHVVAGLPRLHRRHAAPGTVQTPLRFGSKRDVLIREAMPHAAKPPVLDPARFARVVFRCETRVKVKELAGFRKPHKIPVSATPAARAFVARLAADDVQRDLDRTVEAVREQFGYKRKEIDRGPAVLRTPDFEYAVTVDLDPDDPAVAVIRRDVSRLRDAAFVRSTGFATFGKRFDALVFEFAEPLDVVAFVDCLEDPPGSVATVTLSADGRSAEVTVPGIPGRIVVARNELIVRGRGKDAAGLLDLLLAFLAAVGPVGDPARALVPSPSTGEG